MNKITFKCFFQQFRTLEQSGFSFFQFLLAIQIILVSLEKLLIFHIFEAVHKLWNSDGGQEVGGIIMLGHSAGGIEVSGGSKIAKNCEPQFFNFAFLTFQTMVITWFIN